MGSIPSVPTTFFFKKKKDFKAINSFIAVEDEIHSVFVKENKKVKNLSQSLP
jgi:hypothetical protein